MVSAGSNPGSQPNQCRISPALCPSAVIPQGSQAQEMALVSAETSRLCRALTRVADLESFSVVGVIRGPAEIDAVPAACDGQRGRVVPAQRQEQRALPRGTCRTEGRGRVRAGMHRWLFCRRNRPWWNCSSWETKGRQSPAGGSQTRVLLQAAMPSALVPMGNHRSIRTVLRFWVTKPHHCEY